MYYNNKLMISGRQRDSVPQVIKQLLIVYHTAQLSVGNGTLKEALDILCVFSSACE